MLRVVDEPAKHLFDYLSVAQALRIGCYFCVPTYAYIWCMVVYENQVKVMMNYDVFKCPICKKQFENPNTLREHRLKEHKNILQESNTQI